MKRLLAIACLIFLFASAAWADTNRPIYFRDKALSPLSPYQATSSRLVFTTDSVLSVPTVRATNISGSLTLQTLTPAGIAGSAYNGTVARTWTVSATAPIVDTAGVISIPVATAIANGYLSSTDWVTFNAKESALTFSAPLSRSVNTISIPVATAIANGYLSSADWVTFNAKEPAITAGTTAQYWRGDKTFQTLSTAIYALLSGTAPITFNSGTGAIGIPVATALVNGYLSSADWTTFNSKQAAGNYITDLNTDVVATGPGAVAATIQPNVVTNAKLAQMATLTIKSNITAGTANAADNSLSSIIDACFGGANGDFLQRISGSWDDSAYTFPTTAPTVGDIPHAATTAGYTNLADIATGNVLLSGGIGVIPFYGKVGLTTHVSGILPVANGGTNAGAFTQGSVVFAGASGTYTQDNAGLFYGGSTNHHVGVGTATPDIPGWGSTRGLVTAEGTVGGVLTASTTKADAASNVAGALDFVATANTSGKEIAQIYALTNGATANNRGGEIHLFTKANGGAGDDALVVYNTQDIGIKAGQSTGQIAKVGGTLTVNTTSVGNIGGGADNLMTYSVPANTLATNGDYIEFEMSGTTANTAVTKTTAVVYGATTLCNPAALAISVPWTWTFRGKIIRTGATTQKAICVFNYAGTGGNGSFTLYTTPAETLSGAVTLKGVGTGTSDNDIVQEILTADWASIGS